MDTIFRYSETADSLLSRLDDLMPIDHRDSELLSSWLIDAITQNLPIKIEGSGHLGDNYMKRYSLFISLQAFCQKHKLPTVVPHQIFVESLPSEGPSFNLTKAITQTVNYLPTSYMPVISHYYISHLVAYSRALGIELREYDLRNPPLPLPAEAGPMAKYDPIKVMAHVKSLRETHRKSHYFIITRAGSKYIKRFGRNQVRWIERELVKAFPDSGFIIITPDKIDPNGAAVFAESEADLIIQPDDDINLTVAAFLFSESLNFLTTDTFLAWLGAGAIALRPDRRLNGIQRFDVIDFFSVASPRSWGIPGTTTFASEVMSQMLPELKSTEFFITDVTYLNHNAIRTEVSPPSDLPANNKGIGAHDVQAYINFVISRLGRAEV